MRRQERLRRQPGFGQPGKADQVRQAFQPDLRCCEKLRRHQGLVSLKRLTYETCHLRKRAPNGYRAPGTGHTAQQGRQQGRQLGRLWSVTEGSGLWRTAINCGSRSFATLGDAHSPRGCLLGRVSAQLPEANRFSNSSGSMASTSLLIKP
jgi:hypothetical protein